MVIDIDRLPKDGLTVSRNFDFPSLELVDEEAVFLESVHADMTVKRVGDEVWITGRVTTRLSFVCSRCLSPFEFPVDSRFDLVYLPEDEHAGVHELKDELDDEDADTLFYQGRQIDLREVALEQLNLTFPIKPLCAESCEGICAVCGKVRKDGECGCLIKEFDDRLDKLKTLMKDKR
ncbi:MAG: DUF177 domain-containing protein [Candidatus Aminicenantes bacterium]|nr:DUF177 domain-containing protein [Candidatus Aminicenantes bacterium]